MGFYKSTGFGVYAEQPVNQGKGEAPWVKMSDTEVNFKVEEIIPSIGSWKKAFTASKPIEKDTELFLVDNKNNVLDFKVEAVEKIPGTTDKLDILEDGSALETFPLDGNVKGLNRVTPVIKGKEQYTDSPFGKAFLFDGKTYIDTGMKSFPETITLSFWMKQPPLNINLPGVLFTFSKNGQNTLNLWQVTSKIKMYFNYNDSGAKHFGSEYVFDNNTWHHYVIDSSGKLYVDGKLVLTFDKVDMSTINVGFVIGGDIDNDKNGKIVYNDFSQNGTAMAMIRLIKGSVTEEDVKKLMNESLKLNKIDLTSLNLEEFPKFIGKKQLPHLLVNTGNGAGDMVLNAIEEPIEILKEDEDSAYIIKPKLGEILNVNGIQLPNVDMLPTLKISNTFKDGFKDILKMNSLVSLISFNDGVKDLKGNTTPTIRKGSLNIVKDSDGITYNKFNGNTEITLPGLYQNGKLNVNTVVFDFKAESYTKEGFIFGTSLGSHTGNWYEFGEGDNKGDLLLYTGDTLGRWTNGITIKNIFVYDNKRHLYSVSIDNSGNISVYRDGELVGTNKTTPIGYVGNSAGEITIGKRYDDGWSYLNASMSMMIVFNKVLDSNTLSYLTGGNADLIKLDKSKFNIKDKGNMLINNSLLKFRPLEIGVDSFVSVPPENLKLDKGIEVITDQGKVKISDVVAIKNADSILNILGDNSCIAAFPLTSGPKDLGNKYNLETNNISYGSVAGYKALDLTGKDKSSGITHTAVIKRNGSKEVTISGWIYIKGITGDWQSVWHFTPDNNDDSGNSRQPALWIHGNAEDGWHIRCDSTVTKNDGIDTTPNSPIKIGQWLHIVQVVGPKNMEFYVNGDRVVHYTTSSEFKHNDGIFYIGDKWYGKNFYIRDVRIFNKVLSSTEVKRLYNNDYIITEIKYDRLPKPPKFIAMPNKVKPAPLKEVKFKDGHFTASFADVTGNFTTLQRKVVLPEGMELLAPIKTNLWKKN